MKNLFLVLLLLTSVAFGKVYDCFMFFNELDVLEIRLNELYDHVDKFVLVEAAHSHRKNEPKPYYFEQEKHRFEKFLDKIVHIKLDELVSSGDSTITETTHPAWVREKWQRNQIMRGLVDCGPDDLVLISDVDEIIPHSVISQLHHLTGRNPVIGFRQKHYAFFLNRSLQPVTYGTAATRYKHLTSRTPTQIRFFMRRGNAPMLTAGWHFNSMGGYENVVVKYYGIVEGYDPDKFVGYEQWRSIVSSLPLVPIDESYPKFVQGNQSYLVEIGLIDVQ